ncbi:glycerophosphoryl diester phosphodiesterase [Arthrobacter pigmenti]|uniref:Glycerophosphoryl diester phosphodiesterase n=1 Tax=Arthrobacter pigmenti TaxID=271432 RepID=A0A846RLQ1_9MICC|nr:glycerophosphoryl diester phosphodiesterase [Arthrobacter pigmenti]
MRSSLLVALRHTRAGFVPQFIAALAVQGVTALATVPAITVLFQLVLSSAGVASITDRNLPDVLSQPIAVVLLVLIAMIALTAVCLQLITVIVIANRQQCGQSLQLRPVLADVGRALKNVLHYQSLLLLIYVFLIMPLGGFGWFSSITRDIAVPLFISGEMMKTPVSAVLYGAAIGVAVYLNLRLIFTFPLMVIDGKTASRAVIASIAATRGQSLRVALLVLVVAAVGLIATSALAGSFLLATSWTDRVFPAVSPILASVGYGVVAVGSAVILCLAVVVTVHALTAAYRQEPAHAGPSPERTPRGRPKRTTGSAIVGAGLVSVLVLTSASAFPSAGNTTPTAALDEGGTAVIAHRGFVGGGVENTISALEAAAAVQPDFVEIDVQETRDGGFILSHDTNLWLVSGRNVNTYELTLEEATNTTVSVGGFSDTMSSMRSYVARAEELGVTLMIELKLHGHESPDYVDNFLAELDAMGSTSKHIYHSLSVDAVRQLKTKRPGLTVGRTVAASIGNVTHVPSDFLLVEQSFFREEFIEYTRAHDQQLLVWTVNDTGSIRNFLRLGVDGIVTDHPDVALREREQISEEQGASPWLRDAVDEFTPL